MNSFDLIIIGSGPGGYATAGYAAKKGMKVCVIERQEVGGTCLNRGCIPTKCLVHDAELMRNPLLTQDDRLKFSLSAVMERKDAVVEQLRQGVESLLSAPGITLVRGNASFADAHTVRVGNESYTATNIIIATGSRSKLPPVEGITPETVNAQGSLIVTSSALLKAKNLPRRLCIIGAGVIGMEFASAFQAFGCEVTVVEFLKECLPALDADIAKRLRKCMEKRGVTFYLQSAVASVAQHDGECAVTFNRKGKETVVNADLVLVATGRAVNVEGLNLEAAGVEYSRKGIVVDDDMRTQVPGIYAIGDVNGRMMLAHAATFQGRRAVNNMLHEADGLRLDIMPAAIFTYPEAASVGPSEDVCKAGGHSYKAHKAFYRANGKALAMQEPEGMVKLLTDEQGKIISCHAYGAHAADIIQEVSALMCRDTTFAQLQDMIHIHPTLGELLVSFAD